MFSGIVGELGRVVGDGPADRGRLHVASSALVESLAIGDSVAVNGCCLTVASAECDGFSAEVMPQTLQCTNLDRLGDGDVVNLETSLRFQEPVGGHLVSGHIDALGDVLALQPDGNAVRARISAPSQVLSLLAEKGSVAVDGISLTVAGLDDRSFSVSLTPHTRLATTAGSWRVGTAVNLEADMLARYVQRVLDARPEALRAQPSMAEG